MSRVKVNTTVRKNKIAIIAGTRLEFKRCCEDYQLSREEAFYVTQERDFYGLDSGTKVIWYGTYYHKHDQYRMERLIQARGFIDVTEEFQNALTRRRRRGFVAAKRQGKVLGIY